MVGSPFLLAIPTVEDLWTSQRPNNGATRVRYCAVIRPLCCQLRLMINDNYFCRLPRTRSAGSWTHRESCETARFPCGGRVDQGCPGAAIARETDVGEDVGGGRGVADLRAPERPRSPEAITASTETFTAHIFSRARVATTSPSLRKPRARLPHSVNVPKRTFTPFGLLRLQNPQQRPPERCVVERAAVRTGKNS